jgi:hypothetical protein
MEDEFLVLLEDRLGIGTCGVDPELQHAAGAGEGAGNPALALDLAGIADVDDHDVGALRGLDRLLRAQRLDLGIGFVEERVDAAMNGLGHCLSLFFSSFLSRHSGALRRREPGISIGAHQLDIPDQSASRTVRNDGIGVSAPVPSSQLPAPRS